MKKALFCLALSTLTIINQAHSEEANRRSLNPWTQCGLGAMIFNGDSDAWGIAAAISNITWDLGTTAVTSNVSSQETCERANLKAAMFINENLSELEQQTAQGYGNHIDAMLDLYQCDSSVRPQVVSNLRRNMASTVSASDYASASHSEKAFSYYSSVETATNKFSKQCQAT